MVEWDDLKKLSILGSTGSVGKSTLDLVDLYPDRFQVSTLAARKSVDTLYDQALKYRPQAIALWNEQAAQELRKRLPTIEVLSGEKGVTQVATHSDVDMVVAAIEGAAGLVPTYHALLGKKDIAIANKETLVMAGELIMSIVRDEKVTLLPVDSEHSALHQCLRGAENEEVHRLVLTASGGPFFDSSPEHLNEVTIEEALDHPTWTMGPKITIDSATLMNKGLEVIEAHHLFGIHHNHISIVVHPQSIIHSLVEFVDGTVLAQMSTPDMRSPILYALAYPERWDSHLPRLDLLSLSALEFHPPDWNKFPCIRLAYQALESGQTYPTALNAANEVAVHSFLNGSLPFSSIPEVVEKVLNQHQPIPMNDLETVLEVDHLARQKAENTVKGVKPA